MKDKKQSLLNDLLTRLLSRNIDLQGRRVINAENSRANQDYVTRAELHARIPQITFGTLSPDKRPTNPSKGDIFISTDFAHTYYYTGTAWQRLGVSGFVGWFPIAPGTGWHLCDGTAGVTYSKDDGTTATMTVPTLNSKVVARWDSAYSGPAATAASAPTLNNEPHNHTISSSTTSIQVGTGASQTVVTAVTSPSGNDTAITVNANGHDKLMDGLPYIRL